MMSDNIQALVRSRLEQADDALNAARILLEQHSGRAAVNRAYYAMFYAVLALLALRKQETSRPVMTLRRKRTGWQDVWNVKCVHTWLGNATSGEESRRNAI